MIQRDGWYMIREMLREGLAISEIARRTGRDRKTIREIRDAPGHPTPQERRKQGSKLDPYVPYLRQRVAAGVLNAVKLLEELRRQGYTGGVTLIRRFLHPLRQWVPIVTERFDTARRAGAGGLGRLRLRLAPRPTTHPLLVHDDPRV